MKARALVAALALGAASLVLGGGAPAAGPASSARAGRARALVMGLDLDAARAELAGAAADDPAAAVVRALLALYEGDCDAAVAALVGEGAQPHDGDAAAELLDVASGCARVTASTVTVVDEARGIVVRLQDEADRPLVPLILETAALAREQLTRDLEVDWPRPTRITVVRDLLSLSAMTGLPYEAARTTGTVGIAKWGRVTLLSPRAARHGFSWRDTLAHELTHLAVTRATADRAPLWLQEGTAKREETRWRAPGPFDDRPPADAVARAGIARHMDLRLDALGPSIAMLPSADAALVAFAEVTSFVRFYADAAGARALPRLFAALKEHGSAASPTEAALASLDGGLALAQWEAKWRASLTARPVEELPALFGLGGDPKGAVELSERVRLAELLLGRAHASAAQLELDRAPALGASDPHTRAVRARAEEDLDRAADARASLGAPKDVLGPYGPWWAARGRLGRAAGDEPDAARSFWEALGVDPYEPEVACEGRGPAAMPAQAPRAALCGAARALGDPGLGRD